MKPKYKHLEATRRIHEAFKEKAMAEATAQKLNKPIVSIMKFFGITDDCAIVLSSIIQESLVEGDVELKKLTAHFGLTPMEMPRFSMAVEELCHRGLIFRGDREHSNSRRLFPLPAVIDAMMKDDPSGIKPRAITTISDVFSAYFDLQALRERRSLRHEHFVQEVMTLLERSRHLAGVNYLLSFNMHKEEVVMLVYIAGLAFKGIETVEVRTVIAEITDDAAEHYDWCATFRTRCTKLFSEELLEFTFIELGLDSEVSMTMITRERVFAGDPRQVIQLFRPTQCKVMLPEEISEVKLVFEDQTAKQLDAVHQSLAQENYSQLRERLTARKLRGGLTILFHGLPGTGKTESVYQLARQSGRVVLRVEISQIRNMWVGESEKNLKKVFREYREAQRKYPQHPILLFNEADAIFSRRRDVGSSVDQMENSMQNILLQEMEDFDGIIIATTNLTGNMDAAFERRFLYRVFFPAPETAARTRMLGEFFSQLTEEDRQSLAGRYKFTGSTLENIRRKLVLREVVEAAVEVSPDLLQEMIIKECGEKERPRIGFRFGEN